MQRTHVVRSLGERKRDGGIFPFREPADEVCGAFSVDFGNEKHKAQRRMIWRPMLLGRQASRRGPYRTWQRPSLVVSLDLRSLWGSTPWATGLAHNSMPSFRTGIRCRGRMETTAVISKSLYFPKGSASWF